MYASLHFFIYKCIVQFFPKLLASGFLEDKGLRYIVMPKYDIDLEKLFF